MRIKEGQIYKSEITGGLVEVMYQAVDEWVGVKILGTTMENPYVELDSKAFGKNLKLMELVEPESKCPRCDRVDDTVLLDNEGEPYLCDTCWKDDESDM
jgi:hypothetical protein